MFKGNTFKNSYFFYMLETKTDSLMHIVWYKI